MLADLDPATFVVPAGDSVSCGNRRDLVKKQRVHVRLDAGLDVRHDPVSGVYEEVRIFICERCGRDIVKAER